jgi:amino acid adenylation domain-containing protein
MKYLLWHYMAESAQRFPERTAVKHGRDVLTYGTLDTDSTRLANLLLRHGITTGTRVGLYMEKQAKSIVAMHGVSKSGAAYVPVDPAAPSPRAAYILGDCQVSAIITTSGKLAALLDAAPLPSIRLIVLVDGPAKSDVGPNRQVVEWSAIASENATLRLSRDAVDTDPAYLLYTSGSTGNPKGVILPHRHALTFIDWGALIYQPRETDKFSNHAPLHFDLSVFDIYVAMQAGASVQPVPETINPFPSSLAQWIETEGISIWYSVPSALIRMLLHGKFERFEYKALRHLLFAGEVFPIRYLRDLQARLPHVELWNLYGPTETNVCTYYKVAPIPADQTAEIPIGRACENTHVFAVTDDGRIAGPGEVGELLVRGPSVMPGYWGLPDRTARALVRNPFQEAYAENVYKTGDYVKLRDDGNYDFIGRKDNQVKSRGYRIELGEIEQVVYRLETVREAAVVALPDAEVGARLKLVVVPHVEGTLNQQDIESFCLAHLPKYMVPEMIEFRSSLPRTSTGKTDRQALVRESVSI